MRFGDIDIPPELLKALRNGKLVIFAGAGVSMGEPANLPDFTHLASLVAAGTGKTIEDPVDRFLGKLHHGGVDVHTRAAKELGCPDSAPTALHHDLLRLFPSADQVRLVTTNFDLLFEKAAESVFDKSIEVFRAPALPLGGSFNGLVHLHGAISRPHEIVLTDADFGRAYLTEGWARRFLLDAFRDFSVLFVGYSHNDVVMHYLARALPVGEVDKRFALTHEGDDLHRWQVLGIVPLTYPKPDDDDFGSLFNGVQRLALTMSRNLLDWRRELEDLAAKPPPINDEEISTILWGLEDAATTRFFTEYARSPEWLTWLDNRHYLDSLFNDSNLTERDELLMVWLAKHYAVSCTPEMFLLIAKHGMRLNPYFWATVSREVGLGTEYPINEPTMSRWISVLSATMPRRPDEHILLWLGEKCIELGLLQPLLNIFDIMSAESLQLKQSYPWHDEEQENKTRIDVETNPNVEHYTINELWVKGLKPNLNAVAEPLLVQTVRRLEEKYLTLRAWQKCSREGDDVSWHRSAIEPHDQDNYPEVVDVLINAARDCLEWMVCNKPQIVAGWCDRLAESDVPLLRRLAVHATAVRIDLTADTRLIWLLEHIGIHDIAAHHEIYRLVALSYSEASTDNRTKVIDSVLAYRWSDEKDEDYERRTARNHFYWLEWFHDADPHCEQASKALGNVLSKYPEFKPSEHPDLRSWTGDGWVGPQSPWSIEDFLAKSAADWLPELLTYQGEEFCGPDRHGMLGTVAEASKKNFTWGMDLADGLSTGGNWNSDLWHCLLRAWAEMELDEAQHREVLAWLGHAELYNDHVRPIVDTLYSLVRDGGKPYAFQLLAEANDIASALWRRLDRAESIVEHNGWHQQAINHPAGVLTQFWLNSLSLWRMQQDPRPVKLNTEYHDILTGIVKDSSLAGRLGRSIISSQFAFMLAADNEWSRTYLLPLFTTDDVNPDYLAVWDGFLVGGRLNPETAELLESAFLATLPKLDNVLNHRKARIIEFAAAFLVLFATDPLNVWIPTIFKYIANEDRKQLASFIKGQLRRMSERQLEELWRRWLKTYWENRLQGVPVALVAGEIESMIGWLSHLTPVLPEVVSLITRMPQVPLKHFSFIHELRKSDVPQQYPREIAQILIYLGASGSPGYIWHGLKELIDKIGLERLEPVLRQKLEETIARLG